MIDRKKLEEALKREFFEDQPLSNLDDYEMFQLSEAIEALQKLHTEGLIKELERLKTVADQPFGNVKQTIYITLDNLKKEQL